MVKIREAIVVEGRYDKNTISQFIDAPIFQTNGFGIMKDRDMLRLLRQVAQKRGLIILTDSDGGGFVIRNFLKGAIDQKHIKHAYIPDIFGKEKRKTSPGKEGKLGVEGLDQQTILSCLRAAGATIEGENTVKSNQQITKQDFVELGLSGGANSSLRRKELLSKLQMPEHMSANALLQALNLLYTKQELIDLVNQL